MRKFILILTVSAVAGLLFWKYYHKAKQPKPITNNYTVNSEEEESEGEEEDGIKEAQEMDFELTKDLRLGYVPKDRLARTTSELMKRYAAQGFARKGPLGITWVERGPNADKLGPSNGNLRKGTAVTSGRIRAIWVDLADATNQTVWVGGVAGGIWKTTNIASPNATWTPINDYFDNMAIGGICQDPTNTNIMYFGTGEKTFNADKVRGGGIWKSTDHGVSWNLLPGTANYYNVSKILCDNSGNLYVSMIGVYGILRSKDKGATWTNITPSGLTNYATEMELSSTGRLHVVCGYYNTGTSGYRFTDDPANVTSSTWTAPTTTFNTNYNSDLAVKGDTVYALPAASDWNTLTVYQSVDGGVNWAATPTQIPTQVSSGQAWYNMAIVVDPADGKKLLVGGLNVYKSSDAGATWKQISAWVNPGSLSYVHADQQYAVWNGNQVIMASDGGIDVSTNSGETFTDRNTGLRLKQFYSVAAHPTNVNYFLGGTQDNGVHQLYKAGMDSSYEVTGGDGAFTHIDQLNPQYQFGSYVFNQYRRSTDGGQTWSKVDYSSSVGQFINPTDYDSYGKKMYCGAGTNQYLRWENPTSGSTFTPVSLSALNGTVRHVSVSPYTPSRVFFGSSSGNIVRVDNADQATISAAAINSGTPAATVSCIAIGTSDDNLLATYSNYGQQHVWFTSNGGQTWTNVSGNLPDIPVRWAVFYPESNSKVILATESGVWETDNLNGSSTSWVQNTTLPFVRTDMLKYRRSDNSLVAATHGRGMFTASLPKLPPYVRFLAASNTVTETTTNTVDGCRYYTDYTLNLGLDNPPTGDANVTLSVKSGGTATQGVDFDFTTNGSFTSPSSSFTIPSGSMTTPTVTLRVYDDAEVEPSETFTIQLSVSGSTDAVVSPSLGQSNILIKNNKNAPVYNSSTQTFILGNKDFYLGNTTAGQPLDIRLTSKRNQMVYRASELTAIGMTKGNITSIGIDIQKNSVSPYKNLNIKMGTTTHDYLWDENGVYVATTSVYKTLPSYTTINGINEFILDNPFVWDGVSNIVVEICYQNDATTTESVDRTIGFKDGGTSSQASFIWSDNVNCSQNFFIPDLGGYSEGLKPRMQFKIVSHGNEIATSGSRSEHLANNGNYYFYNGVNIINQIKGASAALGCVSSNILESGNVWKTYGNKTRSGKVFEITPSQNSNASYTVGLYYTSSELAGKSPADLQILKTNAATIEESGGTTANTVIGTTTFEAYGDGYLFTASFTGFSKFFLAEKGVTLPIRLQSFIGVIQDNTAILKWQTAAEQNSSYFEVQKSKDGTNNFVPIGKVNAAGFSNSPREYTLTDKNLTSLNYYRLRIVDKDGKQDFSNTLLLRYNPTSQKMMVVGNPFRDEIKIQFEHSTEGAVKAELYNSSGAKVFSKEYAASDLFEVNTEGRRLPNGAYILKVFADKKVYTEKVVKRE